MNDSFNPIYSEVLETIIRATVEAAVYATITGSSAGSKEPQDVRNFLQRQGVIPMINECVRAAMTIHSQICTINSETVIDDTEATK